MTAKTAKKNLDTLLREYVLKRDENKCQWCGKYGEGSQVHVSHVVPKSQGNKYRWNIWNVKLLCFFCHRHKWHDQALGRAWFDEKYPDRVKKLDELRLRNDIIKMPRDYEIIKEYLEDHI